MSGMRQLYRQELISLAPDGLSGMKAEVRGSDLEPVKLLSSVLSTIGCAMDGGLRLHLGAGGRRLSVFDPVAGYVWPERVLAMNCLIELKTGGDLALPYDAPLAIDQLAASYGSQVKRYLSCPSDESDRDARRLAANQPWTRDGLMMAVRLLNWLKRTRSSISGLLEELPAFAVTAKTVPCSANPGQVLQKLNGGRRDSMGREAGSACLRESSSSAPPNGGEEPDPGGGGAGFGVGRRALRGARTETWYGFP